MQYAAFCILLLAISEPLLIHAKKVVLVLPRQIRRSPGSPYRSNPGHYKKSSHGGNEYHQHNYHGHPSHFHPKRPVHRRPPFPHGGDDFDQGHENVNHVRIPYGKDVSHAITFGKGYVPYDSIKGSFSFGSERYLGPQNPIHRPKEQEYAQTSFASAGSEYSPSSHSFETAHSDSYFSDGDGSLDYRERRNDRKKFYASRSIEKDLGIKTHVDTNNLIDNDKEQFLQQKATELYKGFPTHGQGLQGAIILPSGVPAPAIGGSKEGIVLRDTVALDEYHKKLQELTKSWPQFLTGGTVDPNVGFQQQQVNVQHFSAAGLPGSSFTGSATWVPEFAQSKQGYAVKEETMEPSHDFRTMPIQTSPLQGLPVGLNVGVTPLGQAVHG